MSYTETASGIKSWAEDDRPREKMILKGKSALSDAELIAILIGMGTKEHSAVDLAKIILKSVDYDLHLLTKLSISDLKKVKGIGEAKAVSIMAALELGRRRKDAEKPKRTFLNNSRATYEFLKPFLLDLRHEEFWLICLNRKMEVLKTVLISSGGMAATIVDPKVLFINALENMSDTLIFCHNHPSGALKPSQEDITLTKRLKDGAGLLDIRLSDHIIFTDSGYYSFADNGIL